MSTSARSGPEVTACASFEQAGETICRIAGAAGEAGALELLAQAVRAIGAEVAIYCSSVSDRYAEQLRFMLACDPAWFLEHEKSTTPGNDPWLAYARERSEVICASRLSAASRMHVEGVERARRFSFESALVAPSPSNSRGASVGVLVLGSSLRGRLETQEPAATAMARWLSMELQQWWLSHGRRDLIQCTQLTPNDIDLLQRERRGCGTKEIARQLLLTKQAIDSRFQRLNVRLGVAGRKTAASLAAAYGLI
jgi:DNA-binding CsgD family transcriptional regulator